MEKVIKKVEKEVTLYVSVNGNEFIDENECRLEDLFYDVYKLVLSNYISIFSDQGYEFKSEETLRNLFYKLIYEGNIIIIFRSQNEKVVLKNLFKELFKYSKETFYLLDIDSLNFIYKFDKSKRKWIEMDTEYLFLTRKIINSDLIVFDNKEKNNDN